ncbi:MAG TPA: hypothetical protein VM901_08260 [Bdellovibrionota bacterium]|jgi:hypothetical protein|nr:hypothetical protein [Bdellovibrionota bacterium]
MKKNMLMIGALALAFAGVSAQAGSVTYSGTTLVLNNNVEANGDTLNTQFQFVPSFKFDAGWLGAIEYFFNANYTANGEGAFSLAYDRLRFVVSSPSVKEWSAKSKFRIDYRYTAPLSSALQMSGSYGTLAVRPVVTLDLGSNFSFMSRTIISLGLNRNGYAMYSPRSPKFGELDPSKGNALFSAVEEIFLTYNFTPKFSATTYWAPGYTYYGQAKGADEGVNEKALAHQHVLTYEFNDKYAVEAGIGVEKVVFNKKFKLFTKASNIYNLDFQVKF